MIIGLAGKAQVGKDTVADYLVENFRFEKFAFATALKQFCLNLYCLSSSQLNTPEGKSTLDKHYGKTPRELLQKTGEALRGVYPNIWVDQIERKIYNHHRVVISDVRYKNEAEFVKNNKGILIRLVREDFCIGGKEAQHISENDVDSFGSLVDLTVSVKTGEVNRLKSSVVDYLLSRNVL
jgi:hypothetical protein